MGALVTLSEKTIEVLPGAVATCTVTVKNTGTVVDEFTIDVLGDAAAWAAAEPATFSLFPGAEGTATVVFRPPRAAATPAGELPFGVRARSQEDPAGSAVEEGVLDVGTFQDPFAELVPRTSRGSRGASHELAVDNRGNGRLNATVTAADQDQLLAFDVKPPGLVVEPGTAGVREDPGQARASASGAASPRPAPSSSPSRARAARPSSSTGRCSRRRSSALVHPGACWPPSRRCSR